MRSRWILAALLFSGAACSDAPRRIDPGPTPPPADGGAADAGPEDADVDASLPQTDGGHLGDDAGMSGDSGLPGVFFGEVFRGTNLGGSPIAMRQDPFISFDWGMGPPQAGVPSDNFSIRWTGTIRPPTSGVYTLVTIADDGVRLWVDDELVIDNWMNQSATRRQAMVTLQADRSTSVRLEYFDSGFDASIRLRWSGPGLAEEDVPAEGAMVGDGGVIDGGVIDAGAPDGGVDMNPSSMRHTARILGTTAAANGYWEYLPPRYSANGPPHPLLVFWHGVGENGNGTTQLQNVLVHGPPQLIAADLWPSSRPFVVLSPQHGGGGCPTVNEIRSFLSFGLGQYNVDPARVYLTGLSCGAIGAWGYLGQHTDSQVAAAVLIAGDGRNAFTAAGCNLGRVAIWGFHGLADDVVSPQGTIQAMNNLIACPNREDARLTTYPGVGHDSWTMTYDLSAGHEIYEWLLQHQR